MRRLRVSRRWACGRSSRRRSPSGACHPAYRRPTRCRPSWYQAATRWGRCRQSGTTIHCLPSATRPRTGRAPPGSAAWRALTATLMRWWRWPSGCSRRAASHCFYPRRGARVWRWLPRFVRQGSPSPAVRSMNRRRPLACLTRRCRRCGPVACGLLCFSRPRPPAASFVWSAAPALRTKLLQWKPYLSASLQAWHYPRYRGGACESPSDRTRNRCSCWSDDRTQDPVRSRGAPAPAAARAAACALGIPATRVAGASAVAAARSATAATVQGWRGRRTRA